MGLFSGDMCDIWRPTKRVNVTQEVLRSTYEKVYSSISCQFQDLPTSAKLLMGIDESRDAAYCVFAHGLFSTLNIFDILVDLSDDSRWLITKPVIHYKHEAAHWCATCEILLTWPSEVV